MTMLTRRRHLLVALLVCSLAAPLAAVGQSVPRPDSMRIARLAALGRLWGAVRYFHPALASRPVDWDSALVAAIPRVRAANGRAEYTAAIDTMLAALHDPLTRVVRPHVQSPRQASAPRTHLEWQADSTLVVTIGDPADFAGIGQALQEGTADIGRARRIVFDLRTRGDAADPGVMSFVFDTRGINGLLVSRPMSAPSTRTRIYSGFPTQSGGSSGGYWAGFTIIAGETFQPRPNVPARRVVFLADRDSDLPPVALALQRAGSGSILLEGAARDLPTVGAVYEMRLADSVTVALRTADVVAEDGTVGAEADDVVSVVTGRDAALDAALRSARGPAPSRARGAAPPAFVPAPERSYAEMTNPSMEYRLLAAFRYWTAINYFYAYKALMGEDWNAVLESAIPKFERANDSLAYALAVAELVGRIHDTHGFIRSPALFAFFGMASPGVKVRYIEGKVVVTEVSTDSVVAASNIRVGDVVTRVDGEDVDKRRARIAPYIAHSTPQALDASMAGRILGGAEGSTAILGVLGADGRVRDVKVPRRLSTLRAMRWTRPGPAWKVLAGNIGYVDLERLTVPQVDSMFEALRGTKAIVFDNRSYPQGTAWPIAPRLTDREEVVGARFQRPLVMSPDTSGWSTYSFVQRLPRTTKPRYHGKTVMLVDERTISQAEHTGLFFEAANGTKFIGSPTTGANGDVTTVVLPGGVQAMFSGHDVRHADGRQLQRVGLQPDVVVRPTIANVRAGRDEVLARAIRYLETGR